MEMSRAGRGMLVDLRLEGKAFGALLRNFEE
jgi:hypothetical protein